PHLRRRQPTEVGPARRDHPTHAVLSSPGVARLGTICPVARAILICGLPGSGKTALARRVARELRAVRLCPDEWLTALDIDLYDEQARQRLEALQWRLAEE